MNPDMAAEQRPVGDDHMVADPAVVRHVGTGHQEVGIADRGFAILLLGGPIDRDPLADDVVGADHHTGAGALIAEILRLGADHAVGENAVSLADPHVTQNGDVVGEDRAAADFSLAGDQAIRPDLHVSGDPRAGLDDRRGSDRRRTQPMNGMDLPLRIVTHVRHPENSLQAHDA